MSYREIDMTKDPRAGQYDYFRHMVDPYASVTVMIDVAELLATAGKRHFFQTVLYLITRAANAVPQLRRRLMGDKVVEYDFCPPSYTCMKPDGVYVYCTPVEMKPYGEYINYCIAEQEAVIARGTLTEDGDPLGHLFVSCLPWLHYQSLKPPVESCEDSHPVIHWGKYESYPDGRIMMPLTLSVNHTLADGLHISQFFRNLTDEMAKLCREINQSSNI